MARTAAGLVAALKALPPLHRMAVLSIEPTDVVVIEAAGALSRDQQENIRRQLKMIWPHNRSLVLTGGMVLKIGTAAPNNGHPPASCDDDAVDEMSHPATLQLLRKAGADVELTDVVGWTRAQRIEARTWALQTIDAHEHDTRGRHTSVRWPDHVSRAHRRRPARAKKTRK